MAAGLALILSALAAVGADGKDLGCSGPDNWAPNMAFVYLKNAGLVDNESVNFEKTRVTLLAQQQLDKDLYRQIHLVMFSLKAGGTIEVITNNNASSEECSMSGVQVFVVSRRLGDSPQEVATS